MRPYHKIAPGLWRSELIVKIDSDDARFLGIYYLTSPHQTSAGCCQLPDGYACADLGWDKERYRDAREILIGSQLIVFDPSTSELFVRDWYTHNPPMNPKHKQGIEGEISRILSEKIREAADAALERCSSNQRAVPVGLGAALVRNLQNPSRFK